jgi:SpoVK/Ycf46/Vps4 family AAA+-type ATPase
MSNVSYFKNSMSVLLTLSLFVNSPLVAGNPPTKTSAITREQLQDRVVHALKQMDICESIIDTLGQSLASGVSKLTQKRKAQTRVLLQSLRKTMSLIKDSAAVHINEQELIVVANLTKEVVRVLTAAVNSGLEVVPEFKVLETKKIESITLAHIDTILIHNDKQLKMLTDLSEKVGLTRLNKIYRGTRKVYKKYHVWPLIEHTIVYTAFLHWAAFVTSDWKLEELEETGGLFSPVGALVRSIKKWTGSPIHSSKKDLGLEGVLVVEDEYGLRYATDEDLPKYILTKDAAGNTKTPKEIPGNIRVAGNPQCKIKRSDEVHSSTSPKGIMNNGTDWVSGIGNIDFKAAMFKWAPGAYFGNYIYEDYKVASQYANKAINAVDDILYGVAKKRNYESLTMPDERFDNVVGRDEIKLELNKVIEYICSPDKFDRAGIKVERGYLLAGDPQNGKTLMAKALAGEINYALKNMGRSDKVRFFELNTDLLLAKGIHHWMEVARYNSPCILFLDEIDLLRLQRDGDSKLLSEFLTCMSGSLNKDEKSHVIMLAATNKPENLDGALREHGRFGKMFWLDKPTFNTRTAFFNKECEKRCMDIERFDFNSIAQQTEGCSFGSLDIVMKKALMLAKFDGTSVSQIHFEKALDTEIKKMIPSGYDVPTEKEQIIAVHQAGKAIVSLMSESQKKLSKITVLPITQNLQEEHVTQQYNIAGLQSKDQRAIRNGGIFSYSWSDSLNLVSQDELKKQCKILLAGNVAQIVFGLPSPTYDKIDKQEAFKIAKEIMFEGLDQKEIAKSIREEKLTQAYRLVEQLEKEIATDLEEQKEWLVSITQALQARKTLSVGELNELRNK